jgi:hypothetical protein
LLVIDHADKRLLLGDLRQQVQHGQPHEKPVRHETNIDPEHGPQRLTLRSWQPLEPIQHRRQQLM